MGIAPRKPLGFVVSTGLLVAVSGLASVTLVQCTMIDDVIGVGLSRSGATGCVQECNDIYAGLYKLELKRHQAAIQSCQQIQSNRLRNECLQKEAAKHEANKDDLAAGKLACQDGCHRQGTGSSG